MKQKRIIWTYGILKQPVEVGKAVEYYQNGIWRRTALVLRIIEQTEDFIEFETRRFRYCIESKRVDTNAMAIAA